MKPGDNPAHEPISAQEYATLEVMARDTVRRLRAAGADETTLRYYTRIADKLAHQWHVAQRAAMASTPSSSETDS